MRAIIFANGEFKQSAKHPLHIESDDLLIAADGGSRHYLHLGLRPHVVIGDFDSLDPDEIQDLARMGVELIRHPPHKDHTDLELALFLAVERGAREIIISGALGLRWDMTLSNVLLLSSPAMKGLDVRIVDGAQEISMIRGGEKKIIRGRPGDLLSLVPLGVEAGGVTLTGLEYPLENAHLSVGVTHGVSNVLSGNTAAVELVRGMLLCVVMRAD